MLFDLSSDEELNVVADAAMKFGQEPSIAFGSLIYILLLRLYYQPTYGPDTFGLVEFLFRICQQEGPMAADALQSDLHKELVQVCQMVTPEVDDDVRINSNSVKY